MVANGAVIEEVIKRAVRICAFGVTTGHEHVHLSGSYTGKGVRFHFRRRASSILLSPGKNCFDLAFFEGAEYSMSALGLCVSCRYI